MTAAPTLDRQVGSTRQNDAVLLAARLMLATLFILAGVNKIGSMEGTVGYISAMGLPFAELVYFGTVALEIVAGLMLAVGFKARYAAIALGAFSILAGLIFHNNFADPNEITALLKNLAIGGGMFALAVAGPGRFSIDR